MIYKKAIKYFLLSFVTLAFVASIFVTPTWGIPIQGTAIKTKLKNYLLNPDFDIWQRNTSFTFVSGGGTEGFVSADMARGDVGAGATIIINRAAFTVGQTAVPDEPKYYMNANRTVVGTLSTAPFGQRIEDVRTLAGKTITWTFYAKCATGTFNLLARMKQGFGTSGSSDVDTAPQTAVLTTTWAKYTFTFNLDSISGKTITADSFIAARLEWDKAQGATDQVQLAHMQLVEGPVGQPIFDKLPFGEELLRCQRYLYKTFPYDIAIGDAKGADGAITHYISIAGVGLMHSVRISYPTPMYGHATAPGIATYNPTGGTVNLWYNASDGGDSGTGGTSQDTEYGVNIPHTQVSTDGVGEVALIHFAADKQIGP